MHFKIKLKTSLTRTFIYFAIFFKFLGTFKLSQKCLNLNLRKMLHPPLLTINFATKMIRPGSAQIKQG